MVEGGLGGGLKCGLHGPPLVSARQFSGESRCHVLDVNGTVSRHLAYLPYLGQWWSGHSTMLWDGRERSRWEERVCIFPVILRLLRGPQKYRGSGQTFTKRGDTRGELPAETDDGSVRRHHRWQSRGARMTIITRLSGTSFGYIRASHGLAVVIPLLYFLLVLGIRDGDGENGPSALRRLRVRDHLDEKIS